MKQHEDAAFLGKEELYSQLSETKLRIALLAQQESETEAMLGEGADAEDEKQFFEATEARSMKAIQRQLRKQSAQHFVRHDLPKVGRIAATVVLVFYLGLTTAVATVQSVRVSLMKLLYNVEEQYTEISFQPDEDASFDVPADWGGNYFMSYIPDGYTLGLCSEKSLFNQEILYADIEGKQLRFAETSLDVMTSIDTEGYSVSPVLINGSSGILAEKADAATVVWSTTDRYFYLYLDGSAEEAKRIAESVLRIK